MNDSAVPFLLTTGGGPGILAQVAALCSSQRHTMRVVLADAEPASGNLFLPEVDAAYRIPLCVNPDFIPAILRLIQREGIKYIYSGLDEEIPILARNRTAIEESGCKVLLPKPEALERALDKAATGTFLQGQVHQPSSWSLEDDTDRDAIYNETKGRLILKTTASRGGRNIYIPSDKEEFDFYCRRALGRWREDGQKFIVQKCIDGDEYNVSTLHDLQGRLIYAVSRRKFEERAIKSSTTAAVIERNDAVIEMALEAVGKLDLQCGFNNVEIIVGHEDKQLYFIEANGGRSAAQDMNLVASGINLTDLAMAILEREPVDPVPHPQDGIATLKIRRDVIVKDDDIAAVPSA